MLFRTTCFTLLLVASLCSFAETKIPAEHFAALKVFSNPELSPDGSKIAAYLTIDGEVRLALMDFNPVANPSLKPTRSLSKSDDLFFSDYIWANEDVLITSVRTSVKWGQQFLNVSRLFLLHSDANVKRKIIETDPNQWGRPKQHSEIIHLLPDDNDHILVSVDEAPESLTLAPEVDKVNVYTGKKRRVQRNLRRILDWISDSKGNLRVGVAYLNVKKSTDEVVYYREPGENFEALSRSGYSDNQKLRPVRFDKDDDNILLMRTVTDESGDSDSELVRFDINTREVLGPYRNEARAKLREMIADAMPEYNVEIVSANRNDDKVIFEFSSDTQPSLYLYLDAKSGISKNLPSPYPQLQGHTFSKMQEVSYEARDGLTIPAFLTVPHDKEQKNLPTIIYPHGGPWSHDEWGFDARVQFFADRGYAVLQPQFRGSTGYGVAHEEAGYRQWGLAIQDDITDGVKWLIDEGIADPEKICIVGASFGGYAAALGLATTPELYKCGVSIAGVLDFKKHIKDLSDYYFSGINKEITNSKKDSKLVSPYHLVDNIEAPLLLIHGTKDTVVPYSHSKKMAKALKKRNKKYEYVELKGAEHWTSSNTHEITKLQAIEKFLAKHLN